ncbi:heme lyase CcmF/NrfE family subunit [Thermomonas sp.]|uniref:heme lyase CcmF/NrfE family subunit n=1 Tax=Thermomonas sp. TaxID=1971895 RepID=UPI002605E65F|nr:heme lyase CcmF/NrfE family subunit [Thermomonas sp.]MCO5054069.1 heme lyase CcmF/NrfE family subunit [Thermomonas sp.]
MIPELGQIALALALMVAAIQALLPLLGAQRGDHALMAIARPAAYLQLLLVGLSFAILSYAFAIGDFSVKYVADNSNSLLPMLYRFTAVWGSHEGSLLLWALVLALWTAAVARFSQALPEATVARVLGVMGIIAVGFLAFLYFTSNPFARLLPAASEGHDLNPLLQDPGLIMHPPMLYAGYVGFSVPFAFAIAALLERRIDAQWLRWTRPWTNLAWAFLTLGIAIGSWWAYYELGWGGWWFWDPVENASFMPWLVGAALIHSQATTEKRGSFGGWTLLLAIAAFSLSLLGTFLVRSGVLTSVHAFAADPGRGLFILIFLAIVIGGSLVLYALRAPDTEIDAKPFATRSRETLLLLNNLLLTTACAMVLLGTLYPLLADALELGKISVGPPYFALMFLLLMAPLVALLPFGPLTRWQRDDLRKPLRLLAPWAALAVAAAVIAFFTAPQGQWKTALGVLGAVWVGAGTLRFVWQRLRASGRLTREMLGMALAHLGIAVFLIGALLVEGLGQQRELAVRAGSTVELGGYVFQFDGIREVRGPNYVSDYATVRVLREGKLQTTLHPEKRRYLAGGQVMTESGIAAGVLVDRYVAIGESLGNDAWAMRVYVKPFVRWIWGGALLMALGGAVTASDKRFRVRASETRRAAAPAAAGPAPAAAPVAANASADTPHGARA